MSDLNPEFRKFHDAIKLDWDDELAELRDKRDEVLDTLFAKLAASVTKPARFNQGSYAMHTGIVPINGDYDIDVALEFQLDIDEHPSPVAVKRWVYDALRSYPDVEMREPCVTVWWRDRAGNPQSHVDLAIYATHDGETHLAWGKLGASRELQAWEPADPRGLLERVRSQPEDPKHRDQMHRVIRYLKRWKDHRFSDTGEDAPRGIALTACALQWFNPCEKEIDALLGLVTSIHSRGPNIRALLGGKPHTDLFAAMNEHQRSNFNGRIGELESALRKAKAEGSPRAAAEQLRKQFGDDFPLPSRAGAAAGGAAIGTSGASA